MIINQYGIRRTGLHAIVDWLRAEGLRFEHGNNLELPLEDYDKHYTFRTFEDRGLRAINESMSERPDEFHVFQIRDPYNWLASRMRFGYRDDERLRAKVNLYRRYLEQVAEGYFEPAVNYNRWLVSEEYRRQVAAWFGLHNISGEAHQRMMMPSSFTGYSFDGRATSMSLTTRWQKYKDNELYRKLLDSTMQALAAKLFNMGCPPWEREYQHG